MLKYILGLGIILLLLIIGTLLLSDSKSEAPPVVSEVFTPLPLPEQPTTVLETPKKFDELLPSAPTNLFQNVLDQMHLDTYVIISCNASKGQEKAVLITAKYVEAESGNNFNAAVKAVSDWESSMLVDIGKIIFPNILSTEIAQPITFSTVPNTPYRIAQVTIAGKKTTLHYGWESNYVVFASTKVCLGEVLSTVQEGA